MADQRRVILLAVGIVLQLGAVVAAALIVAAELPPTPANLGLLILAIALVGLGRIVVRRAQRPEPGVVVTEARRRTGRRRSADTWIYKRVKAPSGVG